MLSLENRKKYFEELNLGEYTAKNVKKLQKKWFKDEKEHDGEYGKKTDILLVNLYRVTKNAPHFTLEEFRCHCGGKYCTGFPEYISVSLLKQLEKVRAKMGGPINITSGLRCKEWNKRQSGSATQSRHMTGKAVDITGQLTNTAAKRAAVKKYWYTLKDSNYCYYGTPNMGSAVHMDVK